MIFVFSSSDSRYVHGLYLDFLEPWEEDEVELSF